MTWAAVIGGVTAAGTAYAANEQSKAAGDAAGQQEEMYQQGLSQSQQATARANRLLRPFRDTGYEANSMLNYLMGFGDPQEMARTEANFDPERYRSFLVERATDNLTEKFANKPKKLEKLLANKINAIDERLEKTGAWKDYKARENRGGYLEGEFWKTRNATPEGAGNDPRFGFLMKRFNNQEFEKDPGYQFRMDEGARATEGSAAARGGLLSGAAMKAMQRYGQGFASNEYGNAYNRFTTDQNNLYNRAAGMQDVGMRAAGAQGSNMIGQGQQAMQAYNNIGDARAAGTMGQANARASGYQNLMNTAMDTYGQWAANKNQNAMLDRMGYPQSKT